MKYYKERQSNNFANNAIVFETRFLFEMLSKIDTRNAVCLCVVVHRKNTKLAQHKNTQKYIILFTRVAADNAI